MKALDDAYAHDLNAMDPDLSAFAGHGGKLIMYHGWADGIISPLGSVDYYEHITAQGQNRAAFARLFMVPGMGHCAGGPGATDFGQLIPGPPTGPRVNDDILAALERWAEDGIAPDQLVAGKTAQAYSFPPFEVKGPTPVSRPICAFPALPRYDGKSDPLQAASFKCAPAKFPAFVRPAPAYLR
jgi:feruloyl esterase